MDDMRALVARIAGDLVAAYLTAYPGILEDATCPQARTITHGAVTLARAIVLQGHSADIAGQGSKRREVM